MAGISVRHGSQLVAHRLTHVIRPAPLAIVQPRPARSVASSDGAGFPISGPVVPVGARASGTKASTARTAPSRAMPASQASDRHWRRREPAIGLGELGGKPRTSGAVIGASRRSTPSTVTTGMRWP